MAQIAVSNDDKILKITHWLGVNENPDGDTGLKIGEFATSSNIKITNDGAPQKRPGTQNIAGLLSLYSIATDTEATTVATNLNTAISTFTAYPNISVTAGGILSVSGTPVTVNSANIATYDEYYWTDPTGVIYKTKECNYHQASTGTAVTGGSVNISATTTTVDTSNTNALKLYNSLKVSAGTIIVDGTYQSFTLPFVAVETYKYWDSGVGVYEVTKIEMAIGYTWGIAGYFGDGTPYYGNIAYYFYQVTGKAIAFAENNTYTWDFCEVTATTESPNKAVQGLWSGRVGANEIIIAACDSRLWALSESSGIWTKVNLGSVDTTNKVHMFGFDSKLYILNGIAYSVWDGTTLSIVDGYRPLIAVATPPAGGGTLLERINMLNGLRRIQFSPNGTSATFVLPEKALTSIDYVKNLATGTTLTVTTDYTVNTTLGTVTFTVIPTAGVDSIEIGYTFPTTFRSQISAMTLSEIYNGVSDSRVFAYGDGSNKAFYSGLDYNGQARADYFPDLNVIAVGDTSTPLTSMIRHYDRLLAFKEDSAYSIRYDSITLATGAVTAGFYCTTVSKGIGCAGFGQAQIVVNHPRTLDGRSIYEWVATTSSGNITSDQRNAQDVSQKVHRTIRELDIPNAMTYFDKINKEFYVVENGIAIVQNLNNGAWYIYRDFPAICMIVYKDELYFGTADGYIRHVSRNYLHDVGNPITAHAETGSLDFNAPYMRKLSNLIFIVLKTEPVASLDITVETDKRDDYKDATVEAGIFDFSNLNFNHLSFNVNDKPHTQKRKIKVKNFVWYKLIFNSVSDDTTFTLLSTSIKYKPTSYVR